MSYLPLLEVSSDLVSWPRSVTSHLDHDSAPAVGQPGHCPMLGKISRSGHIAVIAKVSKHFNQKLVNLMLSFRKKDVKIVMNIKERLSNLRGSLR